VEGADVQAVRVLVSQIPVHLRANPFDLRLACRNPLHYCIRLNTMERRNQTRTIKMARRSITPCSVPGAAEEVRHCCFSRPVPRETPPQVEKGRGEERRRGCRTYYVRSGCGWNRFRFRCGSRLQGRSESVNWCLYSISFF
jgi:hypothetical protein